MGRFLIKRRLRTLGFFSIDTTIERCTSRITSQAVRSLLPDGIIPPLLHFLYEISSWKPNMKRSCISVFKTLGNLSPAALGDSPIESQVF